MILHMASSRARTSRVPAERATFHDVDETLAAAALSSGYGVEILRDDDGTVSYRIPSDVHT